MRGVLTAESAILFELQPRRGFLLVFGGGIIPTLALAARQMNNVPHRLKSVSGLLQTNPPSYLYG